MTEETLSSKDLERAINATWTTQKLCREMNAGPMTIQVWRSKGLPCIIIMGDKRPSIRFNPKEAKQWIKTHRKKKS
jgi:hypothetical protein